MRKTPSSRNATNKRDAGSTASAQNDEDEDVDTGDAWCSMRGGGIGAKMA